MKFIVTLIWPKGASHNDDRVRTNDVLDAPSADVAYARAVAKWPELAGTRRPCRDEPDSMGV